MQATYFDGRSSRRQTRHLLAEPGCLILRSQEGERRISLAQLHISEPQGSAPRVLRLPDDSYCELPQGWELDALLERLGHQNSPVVQLQARWHWSLATLFGVILLLVAAYQWGLPWGARALAPMIPDGAVQQLSRQTLQALDQNLLQPSQLAAHRQNELRAGFQTLLAADPQLAKYNASLQLHFRRAPKIGPNAFALPDGQVVLLDELVDMPASDAEVLAVLTHELGHVRHQHGLRQLIQSSVVAAVTAAYLGDLSSLTAGLASLAVTASYSRDMEREADSYAIDALRRQGRSPAALGSALEKLAKAHHEIDRADGWLASHPDTSERIRHLNSLP